MPISHLNLSHVDISPILNGVYFPDTVHRCPAEGGYDGSADSPSKTSAVRSAYKGLLFVNLS